MVKRLAEVSKPPIEEGKLFIGGEFVKASSGHTFETLYPATNEVLAEVQEGADEDLERAVEAARDAFDRGTWRRRSTYERSALLNRLADLIQRDAEQLAVLNTLDNGKTIGESRGGDVPAAAISLRTAAANAIALTGETYRNDDRFFTYTTYEPLGVVGIIIPWNAPLLFAANKIGASLAAGDTCVVKPSSYTPLIILKLAELCREAGVPEGAVNVVPGPGPKIGAALAAHPKVDMVTFTGETATGQEIMRLAAGNVKKLVLELGGKSANIVFEDADLEKAANGALSAIFPNQGQRCFAGSRMLVQESVYDDVVGRVAAKARRIRVGDPMDAQSQLGALASSRQLERVRGYIAAGVEEGAELLAGGEAPPGLEEGNFLAPTVFGRVDNRMKIAREEIFGPVLSVIPFRDEAQAIEIANDTDFGLAGAIWTQDIKRGIRVAREIRTGYLWINTYSFVFPYLPWSGHKMSGVGRELGRYALQEYSEIKAVVVDLTEESANRFGV